jgi:hypothetical protein
LERNLKPFLKYKAVGVHLQRLLDAPGLKNLCELYLPKETQSDIDLFLDCNYWMRNVLVPETKLSDISNSIIG